MKSATCDLVRDRLPDALAGRMPPEEGRAVLGHAEACAECGAEADLLRLLQGNTMRAPDGLEARIRAAVAARPRRWSLGGARPALLAAALGGALLGGAALLRQQTRAPAARTASAVTEARTVTPGDGRALLQPLPGSADEPLYSSAASLDDLSVEELRTLLKEMQS